MCMGGGSTGTDAGGYWGGEYYVSLDLNCMNGRQTRRPNNQSSLALCGVVSAPRQSRESLVAVHLHLALYALPSTLTAAAGGDDGADDDGASGLQGFKSLLAHLRPANATCFDLGAQAPGPVPSSDGSKGSKGSVACSDWSGCGPSTAWDYQACTAVRSLLHL